MSEQWGYGNPKDPKSFGTVTVGSREYDLVWGEHPHSRSDNKMYAKDRASGHVEAFNGHRVLMSVEIGEENYLKESDLSGDEIRKGGYARIFADGIQVYEFFHRDAERALIRAAQLIPKLHEAALMSWTNKRERDKLVGRKVFYDRTPAIIERLVVDQGCVILKPDGASAFPPPIYAIDGDDDFYDDDERDYVKTEVLDPKIWWSRK